MGLSGSCSSRHFGTFNTGNCTLLEEEDRDKVKSKGDIFVASSMRRPLPPRGETRCDGLGEGRERVKGCRTLLLERGEAGLAFNRRVEEGSSTNFSPSRNGIH